MKQNVSVISVAVAKMKIQFSMCDYMVDSDVGTGYFSLLLGILYVCGHAHVLSQVYPGMD